MPILKLKIPCRKFDGFAVVTAKGVRNVNARGKRNGANIQLDRKTVYTIDKLLLHHVAVYIHNHKGEAATAVFKLKGGFNYPIRGILADKHFPIAANPCSITKILNSPVVNGITLVKVGFAVASANRVKGSITLVGRIFSKIIETAVSLCCCR